MVPEPGQINLSFANFIILLGLVQGVLLTITGLTSRKWPGIIKGLLFLTITLIMAEFFLNRTGYMYRVIGLVDFSEPFQFALAPLIYLGVLGISESSLPKKWYLHFIPCILYFLYFLPFYAAPAKFKLYSYYFTHHLNGGIPASSFHFYRIWGFFRNFQLQVFYLQTTIYLIFVFQKLALLKKGAGHSDPSVQYAVNWWFLFGIFMAVLMAVVITVKILFVRDLGDHIIAFSLTFSLYVSAVAEMIKSSRTGNNRKAATARETLQRVDAAGPGAEKMDALYQKIVELTESQHLYRDNLISLQKISRLVAEPPYLVSKVINDKSGLTFFDWIARHRVEEAKIMLSDPKTGNYTIEQIAEEVGYNSKSAFYKAFRKFTGKTPAEYKNT